MKLSPGGAAGVVFRYQDERIFIALLFTSTGVYLSSMFPMG